MLRTVWGYDDFRPAQLSAIDRVLSGRDGLVLMPTGGGKSISFQVPALVRGGLTVVISPLVSLMQDQVGALAGLGVPAFALTGTIGFEVAGYLNRRIQAEPAFLLYMAPERIDTSLFRRITKGVVPGMIVVDEAHCISSWGHDFRPAYRRIARLRAGFDPRSRIPCVAFTATATPRVARDIERSLGLVAPFRIDSTFRRGNLSFVVQKCVDPTRDVLQLLNGLPGSAIVYDTSRGGTEVWAEKLRRAGLRAAAYHAGMEATERARVQSAWLRGSVRIVVATNAFGMGIDKPDVRLVIHVGIPDSLEAWYQEAGRAGRDGRPALAVTFDTPDARKSRAALIARRLERAGGGVMQSVGASMQAMRSARRARTRYAAMRRWLDREACRTWGILGYFGEAAPDACGACDRCEADLLVRWLSSGGRQRPAATSRARL